MRDTYIRGFFSSGVDGAFVFEGRTVGLLVGLTGEFVYTIAGVGYAVSVSKLFSDRSLSSHQSLSRRGADKSEVDISSAVPLDQNAFLIPDVGDVFV